PNVTTNMNGGVYSVDVVNVAGTTTSVDSTLSVINPANLFHLNPLWSYGPGDTNYMDNNSTTVPNARSIAYNPVNNHLIVVWRNAGNVQMFVLDPNTGQVLYKMNTNGLVLTNINIQLLAVGVAADGAVYACNGNNGAGTAANFRIYRWAD